MNSDNHIQKFVRGHIFTILALVIILIMFLASRAAPANNRTGNDSSASSAEPTTVISSEFQSANFEAAPDTNHTDQ